MADTLVPLRCKAQNYDWGIRGPSSTVGRLYALGSSTAPSSLPTEMPFAELWMGTHPSGELNVIGSLKNLLLRMSLKNEEEID